MVSRRGFLSNVCMKKCLRPAEKVDRNAKTYLGGNAVYGRNLYIRVVRDSSWGVVMNSRPKTVIWVIQLFFVSLQSQ